MGAVLAYLVAAKLAEEKKALPKLLMVSGRIEPGLRYPVDWTKFSDKALLAHVVKLGGLQQEHIENQDIVGYLLPIIKADYQLNHTIPCAIPCLQDFPIQVINGRDDLLLQQDNMDMSRWKKYSNIECREDVISGDHFFLRDNYTEFLPFLISAVKKYIG